MSMNHATPSLLPSFFPSLTTWAFSSTSPDPRLQKCRTICRSPDTRNPPMPLDLFPGMPQLQALPICLQTAAHSPRLRTSNSFPSCALPDLRTFVLRSHSTYLALSPLKEVLDDTGICCLPTCPSLACELWEDSTWEPLWLGQNLTRAKVQRLISECAFHIPRPLGEISRFITPTLLLTCETYTNYFSFHVAVFLFTM